MQILMPQLGETVTEGTVVTWYKREGDVVQADEILLEIETDKAATELPAPAAGVLARILVGKGQTVVVGTPLAILEVAHPVAAPVPQARIAPRVATSVPSPAPTLANAHAEAHPRPAQTSTTRWSRDPKRDAQARPLSPAVRRLLREHGIDANGIVGTGRSSRIRRGDMLARLQGAASAGAGAQANTTGERSRLVPFNRLRRRTAEHMVRSKATSPHVLQAVEVDFSCVVAARQRFKEAWLQRHGFALTFLPFVAYAACRAIAEFPAVNASIEGEALRLYDDVNLAIAVDLSFDGLVAPVVPRAQALGVSELACRIHAVSQRASSGKIGPDELKNGTYTISNSGSFGTLITAPIINQPQVAILSLDGIRKRAVVLETKAGDTIAIRSIGVLAQSFDHRAIDGAYSAAYLDALKNRIEAGGWDSLLEV